MESTASIRKMTAEHLSVLLGEGRDLVLIDTLPREWYEKRRLPGAANACVFEVTFPDQVQAVAPDRDQVIIVYGSSFNSHDAAVAAEKLTRMGYGKVHKLEGGVEAWRAAGYPLEGGEPDSVDEPDRFIPVENCDYSVDVSESIIEWTGRNANKKHFGTVGLTKGEFSLKDREIKGTFEIDMRSIRNVDLEGDELQPVLIRHLKSDDFFFVKLFPKAFFSIKSGKPIEDASPGTANYDILGALTLRGVSADLRFPAIVALKPEGAVSVEAHFDLDRTRWNVIYGSGRFFEHLGMHLVYNDISIQLRVLAR